MANIYDILIIDNYISKIPVDFDKNDRPIKTYVDVNLMV